MARFPAARSFVQAALDAVGRAGMAPVDMRYFAARSDRPADYCRQRVRECDIFVAVVGFHYGSVVPDEEISYTELEFTEAGIAGRPRLMFLLGETVESLAALVDADRGNVDRFRRELREAGLIVAEFSTADGLELEVFHALKELNADRRRAIPQQLPAALVHFSGRFTELDKLTRMVGRRAEAGSTVVVSAIAGTAGVGKTTLAVCWAHRVAREFPDGQLYVNLRGFDPDRQVMDASEAVRRFLDALDVPPERIPPDLEGQAALYRSLLVSRRMLIVLDNARDSAQVRPLLPGAPSCFVLVTSRNPLAGLVASDGAEPISLDVLTQDEARQLLTRRIGSDRVNAEPQAVEEIITSCARLPLALAIVASRAATHPHFALAAFAEELADRRGRLEVLTAEVPGADVRTVFSWSYHSLVPPAARLFRLLGLHQGPDISVPAAASLAALPSAVVRPLLAELVRTNLVVEHTPGRYSFHDLLRAYAEHLAYTQEPSDQRHLAINRVLDHYVHSAYAAEQLTNPSGYQLPLTPAQPSVKAESPTDRHQAMAWFAAERAVLLAAVTYAAQAGFDSHACQLASVFAEFLDLRGLWRDSAIVQQAALDAAERQADRTAQALVQFRLGNIEWHFGRLEDARVRSQQALDLFRELGDQRGQALAHRNNSMLFLQQGSYHEALREEQRASQLSHAAGDLNGQAVALNNIAWICLQVGRFDQSIHYVEQALALQRQTGGSLAEALSWSTLGSAHQHRGRHSEAISCFERALDLCRGTGYRYEAALLGDLGDIHYDSGNTEGARQAWHQALAILRNLDHPDAEQIRTKLAGLTGYRD